MDTGIFSGHEAFGNRVVTGYPNAYDAYRDTLDQYYAEDCWGQDLGTEGVANGHGTHVAGIVGGALHGVAPAVTLVSVRVWKCVGENSTLSGVVSGIEWITENFQAPAVVNFSGGSTIAWDSSGVMADAVEASVGEGVTWIVAAGNDGDDACDYSPGYLPETVTISATDRADSRWVSPDQEGNIGECVDLWASGDSILSAWIGEPGQEPDSDASVEASGTSMAAPHVTGIAAIYLADHPTATPSQVRTHLIDSATPDALSGLGTGSPNLLAFIPSLLGAETSGPGSISQNGSYDWYANPLGGDESEPFEFEWERRLVYGPGNYGSWWTVGTDSILSLTVTTVDASFDLRVAVDRGEQSASDLFHVQVSCDPCPEKIGGGGAGQSIGGGA